MLLFFSFITLIFLIIVLMLKFLNVRLIIDNFELVYAKKVTIHEYKASLCLYIGRKAKIVRIKLNNRPDSINLDRIKEKIDIIKNKNTYSKRLTNKKKVINKLKENIELNQLKLKMYIGTENIILTSFLVGIISAAIPNLIRSNIKSFDENNYELEILPNFKEQNYIYLNFNGIISIKLVHIINMFKLIGGIKDERAPNRRLNANSNGKH